MYIKFFFGINLWKTDICKSEMDLRKITLKLLLGKFIWKVAGIQIMIVFKARFFKQSVSNLLVIIYISVTVDYSQRRKQYSVVSTPTGLRVGRTGGSNSNRYKYYSLFQKVQTRSEAKLSIQRMPGRRRDDVRFFSHLRPMPRLRIRGALPLLPLYVLMPHLFKHFHVHLNLE